MNVIVWLPTDRVDALDEFVSADAIFEMSRHVEAAGLDGVFVTDHPAPDDRWLAGGGHHALEPTVALSFAAAATKAIRLVTNIYVMAYRPPLLAAKTLATLDVLSNGRLTVGVAAGYLRPEFQALGADFEERGARLDEAIDTVTAAWTGETFSGGGPGWNARCTTILPRPAQTPRPPIWCGGNSRAAMTRAVVRADGWLPFATPPGMSAAVRTAEIASVDDLRRRIGLLDELCEQHGRDERPTICFTPMSPWSDSAQFSEEVAELSEIGVGWISVLVEASTRAEWLDAVSSLAAVVTPTQ